MSRYRIVWYEGCYFIEKYIEPTSLAIFTGRLFGYEPTGIWTSIHDECGPGTFSDIRDARQYIRKVHEYERRGKEIIEEL